jgi:hypothetical protein
MANAYADRIEIWQDGQVVGRHDRVFGRDRAVYDPLHYVPVLARKPGALRSEPSSRLPMVAPLVRATIGDGSRPMANAPFKDWELPSAMRRIRRKLERVPGGDRQMVEILAALPTDGVEAVEAACAEALGQGIHSADVVLNSLARRHAAGVPAARRSRTARADCHPGRVAPQARVPRDGWLRSRSQIAPDTTP